jgi:hypothetical protein
MEPALILRIVQDSVSPCQHGGNVFITATLAGAAAEAAQLIDDTPLKACNCGRPVFDVTHIHG